MGMCVYLSVVDSETSVEGERRRERERDGEGRDVK
jgi:hypothetical protein